MGLYVCVRDVSISGYKFLEFGFNFWVLKRRVNILVLIDLKLLSRYKMGSCTNLF